MTRTFATSTKRHYGVQHGFECFAQVEREIDLLAEYEAPTFAAVGTQKVVQVLSSREEIDVEAAALTQHFPLSTINRRTNRSRRSQFHVG